MKADTNNLSSNLKSAPRKYIILDKMFHATKMLFPCVIFKQNSCRLQHHCTFLKTHNPSNADFLFPSKDDEVQREQQQRPEIKKKRTSSPAQSTSRAKYAASHQTEPVQKKKKTVINPVHMKKPTAHDLFRSDSEEEEAQLPLPTPTGNKPIHSYITRRLVNGHSRQVYENKQGHII
ncbi:hypothetical protein ACJJTC_002348 [Scirpophaga incertulas]